MLPEGGHWTLLVVPHVLRSLFADWELTSLNSEIATLRVEVRRAKDLIADYNHVLDACERDSKALRGSSYLGAWVNTSLAGLCVVLWVWSEFCRERQRLQVTEALVESSEDLSESRRTSQLRQDR